MKGIPQQVIQIASDNACNRVEYLGTLEGYDVYSMYIVGKNGLPEPTGLPELILYNCSKYKIVTGEEALGLLGQFDDDY